LGFTSTKRDEVYIRIWENKLNRPAAYKDILTISQSTPSMGGGTNVVRKVSDLFMMELAQQVYMSHDKQGRGENQPRLYRTYMSSKSQLKPITKRPRSDQETLNSYIKQVVEDNGLNRVKIYTDGSYTNHNHPLDTLLQSPDLRPPTATAGLVITDDSPNWKVRPIIWIHLANDDQVPATSVFHTECLALILALALSKDSLNCTGIYTDSESAYKLIRRPKRIQPSSHAPLVRILQHFPPQTRRLVQHIHSHSEELTRDKSRWTQEMYGNHLADRAAANDKTAFTPFDSHPYEDLRTGHILAQAQQQPFWHVTEASRLISLTTITEAVAKEEHKTYLENRDANRAAREVEPRWTTGLSFRLAATQFETNKRRANTGSAARAIRIIYDKYYQPWNVAKYNKSNNAICPECGLQDSLTHLLSHCTHPMYTLTRINTHTHLKRYVNTLAPDNLEYYVANCLLTFVTDGNNANTWTGLWTEEQRRTLLKLIKEHPRYAGNAAQHGHKWAKAAQRVLIGIGYGARQLIRHRHTKDPPPAGVGERLAALHRKDNEQNVKTVEKCKIRKANRAARISNRTLTLIGNLVRLPLPPPEPPPPPQPPP
jgi:hypothetical protein